MVSGLASRPAPTWEPTYLFLLACRGFRYGHEIKELVEESAIDRVWLQGFEFSKFVKQCQDSEGDALCCVFMVW